LEPAKDEMYKFAATLSEPEAETTAETVYKPAVPNELLWIATSSPSVWLDIVIAELEGEMVIAAEFKLSFEVH
jgi:hypothetical protein